MAATAELPLEGSTPSDKPSLVQDLAGLGLPEGIVRAYKQRGLTKLYQWQAECLATPGVNESTNLVYCAPTSGGKTLVSEILMLKRVTEQKSRAIFVLPYVSIVSEKEQYLKSLCSFSRLVVKGFYGGSADTIKQPFDIAVCTIEKANALVNHLLEIGELDTLGILVVDELHLVGDESRGYLLEVTMSKVLFLSPATQVVGLSATLPNAEDIARWLGAALYRTAHRPVPLTEYVLCGGKLHGKDGAVVRSLEREFEGNEEQAALLGASWEVIRDGHSALVFCSSKVKCEKVAALLAEQLPVGPREEAQRAARATLVDDLQRQPCGLDPVLAKSLLRGVAYHHSGVTSAERSKIEQGYLAGCLSVLCATSTLAAGVNLPARRVIFQTPYMGSVFLDATQYKQMAGRAGRAGQGELGEAIMIVRARETQKAFELLARTLPRVTSCLRNEQRGLKRLLLDVLSVTSLGTGEDLIRFCQSTLMSTQKVADVPKGDPMMDHPEIAAAMQWLLAHDMVRLDRAYRSTSLGRAVCASGLEPQAGYFLWQELDRARPCISLNTDLHICYLVTPPDGHVPVDWDVYHRVLRYLSKAERSVAERVGVRLDLVDQAKFNGKLPSSTLQSLDGVRLIRFYNSLVLWAVLHETPQPLLLRRFALSRGNLQSLQLSAAAFTNTVAIFCNRLKWYSVEALILSFRQRLTFGVRQELVPLMQLEHMDCVIARVLYDHGFTTPQAIGSARPVEILRVLRKTLPPNMPSSVLPESNAQRLIDMAKVHAKQNAKEKQELAREARKRMREGGSSPKPKRARAKSGSSTAPLVSGQRWNAPFVEHPKDPHSARGGSTPVAMQIQIVSPGGHVQRADVAGPSPSTVSPRGLPEFAVASCVASTMDASRSPTELGEPAAVSPRTPSASRVAHSIIPVSNGATQASQGATPRVTFDEGSCASQFLTPGCSLAMSRCTPECESPSAAQLGEGLRRVGRNSLTPRDVEAVAGLRVSPRSCRRSGTARDSPTSGVASSKGCAVSPASRPHEARENELEFLSSPFSADAQGRPPILTVPPLMLLAGPSGTAHLGKCLANRCFLGASLVSAASSKAVCLTLGPSEALGVVLSGDGPHEWAAPLWLWFATSRHVCITPEAKELVGALLRHGVDVRCALAEPRIAHWLLDPDDKKQEAPVADFATSHGIRVLPYPGDGPLLAGDVNIPADLRSQIAVCWPSSFLAMPLMAALLRRLEAQTLADSFWTVEMRCAVVLAWMEHFGMACDPRDQHHMYSNVLYKLAALDERVKELVGRNVLLSSGEDVGRALFEDLELPPPRGVRFRRKNNGRIAYRSPVDLLKRVPDHPVVQHVLEHRQLAHAAKRMEALSKAGSPSRVEPVCARCLGAGVRASAASAASLLRIRTDFVQTGTATGRLATSPGSVPLLSIENAFDVVDVWRPSLLEELASGRTPETGARVLATVASDAPPLPRRVREGVFCSIEQTLCDGPIPGVAGPGSLADYWVQCGWEGYTLEHARAVRQVRVQHGASVLHYPADQVWRLKAPVKLTVSGPTLRVNPRQLVTAEAGHVLLSADYSQIEVRLMAHFSRDEQFVRILHEDGDVFRHIAAGWLCKPEATVSAEERSGTKRICYGLIYGIGAGRLAGELGLSRPQAQEFQASFMRQYGGVERWIRACREQARMCGYVETLNGRRRFLPALAARTADARAHAERQAVNTACQASAADLIKVAMIAIHERLRVLRSHERGCRMPGRLLHQIHDELILEVEEARLDEIREIVVSEMVAAGAGLHVPLQVKWKVGRTWGSLEPNVAMAPSEAREQC